MAEPASQGLPSNGGSTQSDRRWISAVPVVVVVLLILAGLILISLAHWRRGAVMVSGAMVAAAVLRVAIDQHRVGPLAVRSKGFDVAFYLIAAAGLAVVAIGVNPTV